MEGYCCNILSMSLQSLYNSLVLVIPDLHIPGSDVHQSQEANGEHLTNPPIVSSRYEVRLVTSLEIVNAVDTLFMSLQGKVGAVGSQLPHL